MEDTWDSARTYSRDVQQRAMDASVFDDPMTQDCHVSYNPNTTQLFDEGLRELLYGQFRVPRSITGGGPLWAVLLSGNHIGPEGLSGDLFPAMIHAAGVVSLSGVQWVDGCRLYCNLTCFPEIPFGYWIYGYAVLGGESPFTHGRSEMILADRFHDLPSLTSNGDRIVLNFGWNGVLQIDPITARLAGILEEVR